MKKISETTARWAWHWAWLWERWQELDGTCIYHGLVLKWKYSDCLGLLVVEKEQLASVAIIALWLAQW